jgi:hypothetical protein
LYEGKLTIDKTHGHASYGCMICCGPEFPTMEFDPINLIILQYEIEQMNAPNSCGGGNINVTADFPTWWTGNTSIATANKNKITGVGAGTTTYSAQSKPMYWGFRENGGGSCPYSQPETSVDTNVAPQISQNQKLWYFGNGISTPQGFTLGGTTATLTASGGGSGSYAWSITAGSSKAALQGTTSGQNLTSVQIASTSYSTSANDVTVQLQFTPTGGSAIPVSYSLSVDSPYKLIAGSVTDSGVTGQSCSNPPPGTSGFQSLIAYTIMSFLGVQITNIGVNETFANLSDDYIGNNWPVYIPGSFTSQTGTFADDVCVIFPTGTPPSLPPQSPLSSVKIDHGSQAWFIGSLTEAAGVEVQSNTLQAYQDHGRHLSIVSPVR